MSGGGASGFYRVHDNWVNNHVFIHDQSNVELYGGNEQITGSQITTFYDLTLTGTGIKSQTLDAEVADSLRLNDRELATDVHTMHVLNTDPGVITYGAAPNYGFVSSLGLGRLALDMDRNGPYFFPVGSSVGVNRFRPVGIRPNNPLSVQTIDVRMANNDATVDGYDVTRVDSSICRVNDKYYHLIGRSQGNEQVQLTLNYDAAADNVWYILANWQATKWADVGNSLPGGSILPGYSTLLKTNWNGFSNEPFALARPNPGLDTALTSISPLHCFNDSSGHVAVTINNGTPPLTYHWSNNNTTLDLNNAHAGSYTLTIGDTASCSRTFGPFIVTQPAQILLTDTVHNNPCNGNRLGVVTVFVDSAALPIASYTWNPSGPNSATNTGLAAGDYFVTVTDANGCKEVTHERVTEPDAISATETIHDLNCYQSSDGTISLSVSGGTTGNPAYTYTWSDSSTINDSIRHGLGAGSYSVTITDRNGCKDSLGSLTVTQPDSLSLTASADTTIAIGYSAPLEVLSSNGGTGSLNYEWTPPTSLSTTTGSNTIATPVNTTTYTVTGTDANGCRATDTIRVRVDSNLVTVPDGFIPDGNNAANHTFHLLTSVTVSVVELKIFNRWGNLLSEDVNGWDGTYKGKPQPMDTYVYQAVIRLPNGSNLQKSGDFILIR